MNDLRVESYGEKEVAVKKQSILKRVAAVGGAVVLTLGLFGLAGCVDDEERHDPPIVAGGAGAWFHSYPEYEQTDSEYTEYEYTEGE